MNETTQSETSDYVSLEEFLGKFRFNKHPPGCVSIRRQRLLMKSDEGLQQRGSEILSEIKRINLIGQNRYAGWNLGLTEFQLNHRTPFLSGTNLRDISHSMEHGDEHLAIIVKRMGINTQFVEVTSAYIPPNYLPTPAMIELQKRIKPELLLPAITTCTTCIDVSLPDMESAVKASDLMRNHIQRLAITTSAPRERYWKRLTSITGDQPIPDEFGSPKGFYICALDRRYSADPRRSPHVMNVSTDGVLRMEFFGSTQKNGQVLKWVTEVMSLLESVLRR